MNINLCLKGIGLDQFFGSNITGAEDVTKGKPAPDVFLEAARKINRSPDQCVVIEDAHVGVHAAKAGGMKVVAVTTTHSAQSFFELQPDLIVDRLDEIDLTHLFG